jgi:hypothetical protein
MADSNSTPLADGFAHVRLTVTDIGMGHILEFRDPDNVALELFAPSQ